MIHKSIHLASSCHLAWNVSNVSLDPPITGVHELPCPAEESNVCVGHGHIPWALDIILSQQVHTFHLQGSLSFPCSGFSAKYIARTEVHSSSWDWRLNRKVAHELLCPVLVEASNVCVGSGNVCRFAPGLQP